MISPTNNITFKSINKTKEQKPDSAKKRLILKNRVFVFLLWDFAFLELQLPLL